MKYVPFHTIIGKAKKQTGFHFPTMQKLEDELHCGEAAKLICATAKQLQGLPVDAEVAEDDNAHYVIEDVIVAACLELYQSATAYNN